MEGLVMPKHSGSAIVINVSGPVPVPVNTDVEISVNWAIGSTPGDGYLNVVVEDDGGLSVYPVGVLSTTDPATVTHHCYYSGMSTVTVRSKSLQGNGARFVDLGAYTTFRVE